MEGRTGVNKWRGPLTYPTPLLVGAQMTLLYHGVRGSGALGGVKDPFILLFILTCVVGVIHVAVFWHIPCDAPSQLASA
jgi:hypothetical protein